MSEFDLKLRQQQLFDFLRGKNNDIAAAIKTQGNITNDVRLSIYKNAYQVRLKETIETDHEILGIYLGDDLFDKMVAGYREQYPSSNTSLREYSQHLPKFLANTSPFSDTPLLAELASFERLLLAAFDAEGTESYSQEQLQQLAPEDWPEMQIRFQQSMQLFSAEWNSVNAWQALKTEQIPDPTKQQDNAWVIWRNPERLTEFNPLSFEEYQLFKLVLTGSTFSQLCDLLIENHAEEKVGEVAVQYLLSWINKGLIKAIEV